MAENIEFKYIIKNEHGTPILADTKTNIIPIGIAHEHGISEAGLLAQYDISRSQLHSALAYFYEHREDIRNYEHETEKLLNEHATDASQVLKQLQQKKQS